MTELEAINILAQVANIAQEKGILKLQDAVIVSQAISVLMPKQNEPAEPINEMKLIKDETVN
jgi:hypothetical protein